MSNYINTEILDLLKSPNWVIFTTQNPTNLCFVTARKNAALYWELIEELQNSPYRNTFESVHGRYNGKYEDAVLVRSLNPITRQEAASIAKRYHQESVLTCEGLVYQNGSCHPIIDWSFPATEPEDNYTLLRSTYFRANIDFEKKI